MPTGQQIRFKGVDKPEKIKSQKFRHGFSEYKHYEEVADLKSEKELRNINQLLNCVEVISSPFTPINPPAGQTSWVNQKIAQQGMCEEHSRWSESLCIGIYVDMKPFFIYSG